MALQDGGHGVLPGGLAQFLTLEVHSVSQLLVILYNRDRNRVRLFTNGRIQGVSTLLLFLIALETLDMYLATH